MLAGARTLILLSHRNHGNHRKGDLWSQEVMSHRLHGLHRYVGLWPREEYFGVPVGALFCGLLGKIQIMFGFSFKLPMRMVEEQLDALQVTEKRE